MLTLRDIAEPEAYRRAPQIAASEVRLLWGVTRQALLGMMKRLGL